MDYDIRWIYRLHRKALEKVQVYCWIQSKNGRARCLLGGIGPFRMKGSLSGVIAYSSVSYVTEHSASIMSSGTVPSGFFLFPGIR